MSRFAIRREGDAWVVIDTVLHRKVDVAPTRQEAETILKKWKVKHKEE